MKWVILIVQIMFILSCSAQKTSNERGRDLYINELSFINNRNLNFSIKRVASDSCFPIIDIGYRIRVKLTPKQDSLIRKLKKRQWINMLNNNTTDYAANILLYYIHNRDATVLLYNRSLKDWRDGMKNEDILYWNETLK